MDNSNNMNDIKRVVYKIHIENLNRTILKQTIQETNELKWVCDNNIFFNGFFITIDNNEIFTFSCVIMRVKGEWIIADIRIKG